MTDRTVADYQPPAQSTSTLDSDSGPAKQAVSRGARACTICRAAKMKCVGAEDDGAKPCQRCRRSNSECVFEKHRRGRKPGSKLSEASKMLRKLEKGTGSVSSQKLKSQEPVEVSSRTPFPVSNSRSVPLQESSHYQPSYPPPVYVPSQRPRPNHHAQVPPESTTHSTFPTLTSIYSASRYPAPTVPPPPPPPPPHHTHPQAPSAPSSSGSHMEDEDDDFDEQEEEAIYPAKMVEREHRRQSFFGTVLTTSTPVPASKSTPVQDSSSPVKTSPSLSPEHQPHRRHATDGSGRGSAAAADGGGGGGGPCSTRTSNLPPIDDPLTAGIIGESSVQSLFDVVFNRLNTFVNLFDPNLHTPTYIRDRSPFLFTVLIMAASKFFRQDIFRDVQKIAEDMCVRAFQEGWKSVEVVQAFMCMTYWKEPDDTRTWTYIGYAARMAVEIGLNRYCAEAPPEETEHQRLERRNRERTYLVLWVHDRSLSMQTGRQWMLPEDEFVRNADHWYDPENLLAIDVVVSAQVALRRIAASVTDMFFLSRGKKSTEEVNYDVLLMGTNHRLQQWNDHWMVVIRKCKKPQGAISYTSLLTFFKLHVRLFLNSFGLQSSLLDFPNAVLFPHHEMTLVRPSLSALAVCYASAVETLKLVSMENGEMLRFGQDSITVMTAYSACFLLKLCRSPVVGPELGETAHATVYDLINATGEAYQEAAREMSEGEGVSFAAEYHGRFLKTLVTRDKALRESMAAGRGRRRGDFWKEAAGGSNHRRLDRSGASFRRHGNGCVEVDGESSSHTPPSSTLNANISYARHQPNGASSSATSSTTSSHAIPPNGSNTTSAADVNGHHTHTTVSDIYQPRPTHPPEQPPEAGSAAGQTPSGYWHFPASPQVPAHPLVSPEDGIAVTPSSSYPHDGGGGGAGGAGAVGAGGGGGAGTVNNGSGVDQTVMQVDESPTQKMEVAYWYTMHSELGYGTGVTPTTAAMYVNMPPQQQYRTMDHQQQTQHLHNSHHIQQYGGHNGPLSAG